MLRSKTKESRSIQGEEMWWPQRNSAGVAVTPTTSMGLAAYYSAVNVVSTDCACMPFRVFRRRPDGGSDLQAGHDVDELLYTAPNVESIPLRFRQAANGHALNRGNGYIEIQRRGSGKPYALHLLDPSITRAEQTADSIIYRSGSDTIRPMDVLHIAALGFDGISGYNPVRLLETTIGLGLALDRNAASFFGNGARPGGYIKHPTTLGDAALKHLRETLEGRYGGPDNAYRLAILEEGMDWVQSTVDPAVSQALESRKFTYAEIAGIFRVPPHKIGDYSQAHLANIEASNIDYFTTALLPWLLNWEQEVNKKLFSQKERQAGFHAEHSLFALLRGDSVARAKFYQSMISMGVFVPNDVARLENLNPIGKAGDVRLVPSNMAQIMPDGTVIPASTGSSPKPVTSPTSTVTTSDDPITDAQS